MKRLNWRIVFGLVVVTGLLAWASSRYEWVEEPVPGVAKGEAKRDPYFAARLFTARLGYSTQVVNDPTLLVHLPNSATIVALQRFPSAIARRVDPQLLEWVRSGGHLVVQTGNLSAAFKLAIGIRPIGVHTVKDVPKKGALPPQQIEVEGQTLTVSLPSCEVFVLRQTPEWSATVQGYRPYPSSHSTKLKDDDEDEHSRADDTMVQPDKHEDIPDPALAMARWRVGQGTVTALCGTSPLSNYYIGKYQNAELVARLLLDENDSQLGPFVFAPRPKFPTLFEWLMDKAWAVVFSAAILLAIVIWYAMPRFGAIIPAPTPGRPGLRDHLRAVAGFHLRRHHFETLLQASREQCFRLMERHTGSSTPDLVEIAAFAGVDAHDLRDALQAHPQHRANYLQQSSILAATNTALQSARTLSFTFTSRSKKS